MNYFVWRRWQHLKYLTALNVLKWNSNETVLDLGCGSGSLSLLLSSIFRKVASLEIDPSQLQEVASLTGENVDLLNSDGRELCLKSKSIDVVFAIGVLEHVPSAQKLVSEVHRVLRKNGLFIVGSPIELGPALLSKWFVHKFFFRSETEGASLVGALKHFHSTVKQERKLMYRVGKDQQFGHFGYKWKDTLNVVQDYFTLTRVRFFPFHQLKTLNPYVFLILAK